MAEYDKGDLVVCSGSFKNSAGTLIDPTTVAFHYKLENGTSASYLYGTDAELVKDAVGIYHANLSAGSPGTWYFRFVSTGTGQAAEESSYYIKPGEF